MMKMKKFISGSYIKKKEEGKSTTIFKRISYIKTGGNDNNTKANAMKETSYSNCIAANVNASDAMKDFYYYKKSNEGGKGIQKKISRQNHEQRFDSNKIISKERSMIKSQKSEEAFIEALVNKSIDYSGYQNSLMLGKSLNDFSLNQSKRDGSNVSKDKDRMNVVYSNDTNITGENDRLPSSILFSYGDIQVPNMKRMHTAKVNKPTVIKINKNDKSKEIDKRRENMQRKADYLSEKSVGGKKAVYQKTDPNSKQNRCLMNKTEHDRNAQCNYDNNEKDIEEKTIPLKINQKNEAFIYQSQVLSPVNTNNNKEALMLMDHSQENHKNEEKGIIPNSIAYNSIVYINPNDDDDDDCNIEDSYDNDSPHMKMLYEPKPISTLQDIIIKTDPKIEESSQFYQSILHKYLFKSDEASQSNLNDSHISQIDKDSEDIQNIKSQMMQREQYYQRQIKKMQYEMNRLDNSKLQLNDSNQSVSQSQSSYSNKETNIKERNVRMIIEKMDNLEASLSQKENEYKSTIKALVDDIKVIYGKETIDSDMMNEINDFLKDDNHDIVKPMITKPNDDGKMNESLMTELEQFKREESLYHFEIPSKYKITNKLKCLREEVIKGKTVKFYDNGIIDVIDKKRMTKRVFSDGHEIWYYANKDIQFKLPNGNLLFFYHKNKSEEFRNITHHYLIYKFSSGQYEKHYFDNSKSIKFSDGSYRITKPNGDELIQFPNGSIQKTDKSGKVTKLKP